MSFEQFAADLEAAITSKNLPNTISPEDLGGIIQQLADLVKEKIFVVQINGGGFFIADDTGKTALEVSSTGETSIAKFSSQTEMMLSLLTGFSKVIGGSFSIADGIGNVALRISSSGETDVAKFGFSTRNLIKTIAGVSGKVNGLKIAIIGDSISTDDGGGNAGLIYPEQYWGKLQSLNLCQIFRNAIGGTTITLGGQAPNFVNDARWQSLNSEFEPDVVLIFGGINDYLQAMPLGLKSSVDQNEFYGALRYLYSSILTRMPNARVFHITPAHTTFNQGLFPSVKPEFNNISNLFLDDYVKAINDISALYGVGIINVNQYSGITQYNIETLSDDQIHVKEQGHQMIYQTIVNTLENSL